MAAQLRRAATAFGPGSAFDVSGDRRYAGVAVPATESLKDTIARVLPYWEAAILPELRAGRRVLVVAHGNSLRALVKHLSGISDAGYCRAGNPDRAADRVPARRRRCARPGDATWTGIGGGDLIYIYSIWARSCSPSVAGLAVDLRLPGRAFGAPVRGSTVYIAIAFIWREAWFAAILAGALIVAPAKADVWTMTIGTALIIWGGFVAPITLVTLDRAQPADRPDRWASADIGCSRARAGRGAAAGRTVPATARLRLVAQPPSLTGVFARGPHGGTPACRHYHGQPLRLGDDAPRERDSLSNWASRTRRGWSPRTGRQTVCSPMRARRRAGAEGDHRGRGRCRASARHVRRADRRCRCSACPYPWAG